MFAYRIFVRSKLRSFDSKFIISHIRSVGNNERKFFYERMIVRTYVLQPNWCSLERMFCSRTYWLPPLGEGVLELMFGNQTYVRHAQVPNVCSVVARMFDDIMLEHGLTICSATARMFGRHDYMVLKTLPPGEGVRKVPRGGYLRSSFTSYNPIVSENKTTGKNYFKKKAAAAAAAAAAAWGCFSLLYI